jgi:5-methylcytosine-specific restriction endonuclease McrBC GTP-binding regulatory subunit McrB
MTTCSTESKEQGDIAYEIRPGIFKKIVDRALADPGNEYALFIDEINRGNVASIFGELITIIEEDKRKDAEYETCVTLPYSQKDFFVPKNLHIYGAMNTADRSIEALDAALRRRFSFEAMYPDPGKIPDNSEGIGVNVPNLLEAINDRIEILKDKDHCIGHSYFMKVKSIDELNNVFRNKVLPLLEEYFYGDMAKIGMILGDKFVERDKHTAKLFSNFGDDSEYESAEKYRLKKQSKWSEGDFRSIYETVPTN